ncbi:unnamed protein product [Polarella glacialis]|uniref:Calmodulin-lysine N-methyltransferase n=1 Tax=Polarella glacialis TaxID=89957 RepID=A0A813HXC2_POLGL|nr:unnamed protein product [Polarella glacialis]
MALAQLGAEVVLTDQAVLVPLLEQNVAASFPAEGRHPSAAPLLWGNCEDLQAILSSGRGFDLVIGSDIGYDWDVHEALLQTLTSLLTHSLKDHEACSAPAAAVPAADAAVADAASAPAAGGDAASKRLVPRIVLSLPRRMDEFERFEAHAVQKGWSLEVLEEVDLPAETGDPTCTPVLVVELRCNAMPVRPGALRSLLPSGGLGLRR